MFYGKSLDEWVDILNIELSKLYNLKKKIPISNGDYGYESYSCMLVEFFNIVNKSDIGAYIKKEYDMDNLILSLHLVWCKNYIKWKNILYCPVTNNPKKYINTNDRNDRSTINDIKYLSETDKELYTDFINVIFKKLVYIIISAGLNQMSINEN